MICGGAGEQLNTAHEGANAGSRQDPMIMNRSLEILLVEDEVLIRMTLADMLDERGHRMAGERSASSHDRDRIRRSRPGRLVRWTRDEFLGRIPRAGCGLACSTAVDCDSNFPAFSSSPLGDGGLVPKGFGLRFTRSMARGTMRRKSTWNSQPRIGLDRGRRH